MSANHRRRTNCCSRRAKTHAAEQWRNRYPQSFLFDHVTSAFKPPRKIRRLRNGIREGFWPLSYDRAPSDRRFVRQRPVARRRVRSLQPAERIPCPCCTACHGLAAHAVPACDVSECSNPLVKNIARQPWPS